VWKLFDKITQGENYTNKKKKSFEKVEICILGSVIRIIDA
jgi:hypothetical protein